MFCIECAVVLCRCWSSARHENPTDAAIELFDVLDVVAVDKEERTQAHDGSGSAASCESGGLCRGAA